MVGSQHICFGEDTLRFNCIEHSSFHSYCSTSVLFLRVLRLALVFRPYFVQDFLILISSLIFINFHLFKLFQISWLVLDTSKKFHINSDANGSLFRLWLILWHVMLDVILITCLVVIAVAWLLLNNRECIICHERIMFVSIKHKIVVFSFDALIGLTWRDRKSVV